jgi:hypothetical protein
LADVPTKINSFLTIFHQTDEETEETEENITENPLLERPKRDAMFWDQIGELDMDYLNDLFENVTNSDSLEGLVNGTQDNLSQIIGDLTTFIGEAWSDKENNNE